jgi:hypothetical protein
MNERIRELRRQAWDYVASCDEHYSKSATDLFEEKFAELIVRQCAEVGLDSVEDGDDLDAIMKRVHNNILTHFGVEE